MEISGVDLSFVLHFAIGGSQRKKYFGFLGLSDSFRREIERNFRIIHKLMMKHIHDRHE